LHSYCINCKVGITIAPSNLSTINALHKFVELHAQEYAIIRSQIKALTSSNFLFGNWKAL